jgi:hypothetical protein
MRQALGVGVRVGGRARRCATGGGQRLWFRSGTTAASHRFALGRSRHVAVSTSSRFEAVIVPLHRAAASCRCIVPLHRAAASCRCIVPLHRAAASCRCIVQRSSPSSASLAPSSACLAPKVRVTRAQAPRRSRDWHACAEPPSTYCSSYAHVFSKIAQKRRRSWRFGRPSSRPLFARLSDARLVEYVYVGGCERVIPSSRIVRRRRDSVPLS